MADLKPRLYIVSRCENSVAGMDLRCARDQTRPFFSLLAEALISTAHRSVLGPSESLDFETWTRGRVVVDTPIKLERFSIGWRVCLYVCMGLGNSYLFAHSKTLDSLPGLRAHVPVQTHRRFHVLKWYCDHASKVTIRGLEVDRLSVWACPFVTRSFLSW